MVQRSAASETELQFVREALKGGTRLDGRGCGQSRPAQIQRNIFATSAGSARASTSVACVSISIRLEVGSVTPTPPSHTLTNQESVESNGHQGRHVHGHDVRVGNGNVFVTAVNTDPAEGHNGETLLAPILPESNGTSNGSSNASSSTAVNMAAARMLAHTLHSLVLAPHFDASQLTLLPGHLTQLLFVDVFVEKVGGGLFDLGALALRHALQSASFPSLDIRLARGGVGGGGTGFSGGGFSGGDVSEDSDSDSDTDSNTDSVSRTRTDKDGKGLKAMSGNEKLLNTALENRTFAEALKFRRQLTFVPNNKHMKMFRNIDRIPLLFTVALASSRLIVDPTSEELGAAEAVFVGAAVNGKTTAIKSISPGVFKPSLIPSLTHVISQLSLQTQIKAEA